MGNRRSRSVEPRSHASLVVKCSKTRDASIREMASRSRGGGLIGLGEIELDLRSDMMNCFRIGTSFSPEIDLGCRYRSGFLGAGFRRTFGFVFFCCGCGCRSSSGSDC